MIEEYWKESGENWYEAQHRLANEKRGPFQTTSEIQSDLDKGHPENRERMKEGDSPFHFDSGKARMDQIPPLAMEAVSQVFGYGAKKYGEHNWARYSTSWKWGQMIGSMLRHIFAWMRRENLDPESGMHHLAHAGCNVMMLLELILTSQGKDDRNPMHRPQEIGISNEGNTAQATYREPRSHLDPGGDPRVPFRPGMGNPSGTGGSTNRTWRPPQHD